MTKDKAKAKAASPDPDPQVDASPVAPGEAEADDHGQYILFYSFQFIFICKFCYFKIPILNFNF